MTKKELLQLIVELRKFRSLHGNVTVDESPSFIRDIDHTVSYIQDCIDGAPFDSYGVIQL